MMIQNKKAQTDLHWKKTYGIIVAIIIILIMVISIVRFDLINRVKDAFPSLKGLDQQRIFSDSCPVKVAKIVSEKGYTSTLQKIKFCLDDSCSNLDTSKGLSGINPAEVYSIKMNECNDDHCPIYLGSAKTNFGALIYYSDGKKGLTHIYYGTTYYSAILASTLDSAPNKIQFVATSEANSMKSKIIAAGDEGTFNSLNGATVDINNNLIFTADQVSRAATLAKIAGGSGKGNSVYIDGNNIRIDDKESPVNFLKDPDTIVGTILTSGGILMNKDVLNNWGPVWRASPWVSDSLGEQRDGMTFADWLQESFFYKDGVTICRNSAPVNIQPSNDFIRSPGTVLDITGEKYGQYFGMINNKNQVLALNGLDNYHDSGLIIETKNGINYLEVVKNKLAIGEVFEPNGKGKVTLYPNFRSACDYTRFSTNYEQVKSLTANNIFQLHEGAVYRDDLFFNYTNDILPEIRFKDENYAKVYIDHFPALEDIKIDYVPNTLSKPLTLSFNSNKDRLYVYWSLSDGKPYVRVRPNNQPVKCVTKGCDELIDLEHNALLNDPSIKDKLSDTTINGISRINTLLSAQGPVELNDKIRSLINDQKWAVIENTAYSDVSQIEINCLMFDSGEPPYKYWIVTRGPSSVSSIPMEGKFI